MKVWRIEDAEKINPASQAEALGLLGNERKADRVAYARVILLRQNPEMLIRNGQVHKFVQEELGRTITMQELSRRCELLEKARAGR